MFAKCGFNILFTLKHTKRSGNTVLCLVSFDGNKTLVLKLSPI
jgi:hypothetical protein